jgi:hypothetical protein
VFGDRRSSVEPIVVEAHQLDHVAHVGIVLDPARGRTTRPGDTGDR